MEDSIPTKAIADIDDCPEFCSRSRVVSNNVTNNNADIVHDISTVSQRSCFSVIPDSDLPSNFLRLPSRSICVRDSGRTILSLIAMERDVLHDDPLVPYYPMDDGSHNLTCAFTRPISRLSGGGVGVTLRETPNRRATYVFAVRRYADGHEALRVGDLVVGINGRNVVRRRGEKGEEEEPPPGMTLRRVVDAVRSSPEPAVLTLRRWMGDGQNVPWIWYGDKVGGEDYHHNNTSSNKHVHRNEFGYGNGRPTLVQIPSQEQPDSGFCSGFELSFGSGSGFSSDFGSDFGSGSDHPHVSISRPSSQRRIWSYPAARHGNGVHSHPPNTPHPLAAALHSRGAIDAAGQVEISRLLRHYTTVAARLAPIPPGSVSFAVRAPLLLRPAVSLRIVNTFLERERPVYAVWAYDVLSGREWYAPMRYLDDFVDLRNACSTLHPPAMGFPFPSPANALSGGWTRPANKRPPTSTLQTEDCREKLEGFLRGLAGLPYTEAGRQQTYVKRNALVEVPVHLQSFLGMEEIDFSESTTIVDSTMANLHYLRQNIQWYAYRICLLPVIERSISQFVKGIRARSFLPVTQQAASDILSRQQALKDAIKHELQKISTFLHQIKSLILENSTQDLEPLQRQHQNTLYTSSRSSSSQHLCSSPPSWDILVADALQTQLEVEAYVPLRGVLSRWCVRGWKGEDLEMVVKMHALRNRPQSFFNIPPHLHSPSRWGRVAKMLHDGVGQSTLPCIKLRSIVEAAQEVTILYQEEHGREVQQEDGGTESTVPTLGADEFLPIFIYCVIQAELERPCALCILLRTLCEPSKIIGETGYYLSTFEAAFEHVREMDLSDPPAILPPGYTDGWLEKEEEKKEGEKQEEMEEEEEEVT
mmetsp:Transcript_37773/g.87947  ORF Transcript_37773/g.87947 Transcript_37773/m.87947 type:complete len:871 (-) Transcript_37773:497-3109(-)